MLNKIYSKVILLIALCAGFDSYGIDNQEDEIWVITQEMVKFGKKEAYEDAKLRMLSTCKKYKKEDGIGMVVCMEETNEPKYIYLHPLRNYKGLDRLIRLYSTMEASWTPEEKALFETIFPGTLNFSLRSLMKYLPSCSYIPHENSSIAQLPWVHYMLITVMPGTTQFFEDRLMAMASQHRTTGSSLCWRSWKMTFGGEMPQYVVAFFGSDPAILREKAEEAHPVNSAIKDIVINQKAGNARYRADLSLMR